MKSRRRLVGFGLIGFAIVLCSSLGAWQVWRGQARARMLDALAAGQGIALQLSATAPVAAEVPRRAQARGAYRADRQLLLDGQAHEGVPGYHVWTPLQLADGATVVVDRGWVPQPAPALAAPAGEVSVSGVWHALPRPGLRLDAGPCKPAVFPAVIQYPTAQDLACVLGGGVLSGVLLLDPGEPGGFVRQWSFAGFPPARHYAYAAQWFLLALVAIVGLFRMTRGSQA